MEKNFNAKEVEKKWSDKWITEKVFQSKIDPSKPSYTVVIPPPNVTGVLHFGHVLNNSLQDFFIRKARKEGYNALWVPGTDHAAIATEAKVVKMLREQGIAKSSLTRDEFLKYCWEWKEKYGGIIINQLKSIGAACDWDRENFTMDEHYSKAVVRVFVDLFKKGYIYKGKRIINWDCEARTALSNEEVIYNEAGEKSQLFHIQYQIENSKEYITIATTRPETIFGDVAIAINPKDERYFHLKGARAIVPLINRSIPIIFDDYVDKEFGTGCLKVTPAHDINDYEIGIRHELPFIDILDDSGKLNESCEYPEYIGKDRFQVRKLIKTPLEELGHLVKTEDIINKVGRSERTNSVVEPKLSLQWYIDMKKLSKKAHEVVMNDEVQFFPQFHKNTYNHWMSNIRDWCISRQLWWGHRIPAYYLPNGEYIVAETLEEAYAAALKVDNSLKIEDLRQDEDVLDTWASSWLWPLEVFKGFDDSCFDQETGKIDLSKNSELAYYLPTKILVTAPEIMFLWVARMIIANYEYTDTKPFEKVFFTGIVRDKQGRKMSKSLGNSPDLYEMIDKYGIDGIRFTMLSLAPAGNDIIFEEKNLEIGRNFSNKIWNALRLLKSWEVEDTKNIDNEPIIQWFEANWNKKVKLFFDNLDQLRISEAFKDLYSFVWDDFCSWYLELIKPDYEKPIDKYTYDKTVAFFEHIISLLNPIMPFITEEMWQLINDRPKKTMCIDIPFKKIEVYDETIIQKMNFVLDLIVKIREIRANLRLKNREEIHLSMDSELMGQLSEFIPKIKKMVWINECDTDTDKKSNHSFLIDNKKVLIHSTKTIDTSEMSKKISDEIQYIKGFIVSVEKKLSNEKFVASAPAQVIENEKKKLNDGYEKLKHLESQMQTL